MALCSSPSEPSYSNFIEGHVSDEVRPLDFNIELKVINGYKLINFIGQGSFGEVFLVQKLDSGQHFAMKVQDKEKIKQSNSLKFVQNEHHILQTLQNSPHPFIINQIESFQSASKLFLVLEYCTTGNMSRLLKK